MSEQEKEKKCIIPTMELVATWYTIQQLKNSDLNCPQIALVGRSNVGKSSLINSLAGRRKLAKVSSTPGKTRSVNVFKVTPRNFYLIDLPGYGYARRAKEERKNWAELIECYLESAKLLCAVGLLIDCRIPLQESDRVMAEFALAKNIPIIGILTKIDKCTQKEQDHQKKIWRPILGDCPISVSSVTKFGINSLWNKFFAFTSEYTPVDFSFTGNLKENNIDD